MDVGLALRNTSKGRIKYDKYWAQEGRTKEVLDEISKKTSNLTLGLSAKILDLILSENQDGNKSHDNDEKKDIPDSSPKENKPKKESENINSDIYFYEKQYETERPILEYEEATLQFMEDTFNSKRKEFDDYSNELQQLSHQEYLLIKRKNELDAKRRAAELDKAEKEILEEAGKKATSSTRTL
ncbi:nucleoporin GLE1 [Caerostris extrusa]|uniref:Nucleoporin GLE1 n=1 Tax=Caerostris extrusa TaxID=172846 RepID=A0AAV4R5T1_CAEEX|nr:nucleoporin GLE1 [Caerostris extrusa]